jgi:general secretion pathway protein M
MEAITTWYKSLEQRERLLVNIGAGLMSITVLCFAILLPFNALVNSRVARVERKQQDLAWMQSIAPTLRAFAAARPGAGGESLVVLIDRTSRQTGLSGAVTAQTPNGEHGMRVRLEAANFDSVIVWLGVLQQQHGVGVESASIDRTEKTGTVNASLVLTRAAR